MSIIPQKKKTDKADEVAKDAANISTENIPIQSRNLQAHIETTSKNH